MAGSTDIQTIVDQLVYNQLYAPEYPLEDRTDIDREVTRIRVRLDAVVVSTEVERKWLRLGRDEIDEAFVSLRGEDQKRASRRFQSAVQYLRNILEGKPIKPDFISGPDGPTYSPK